MIEEERRYTVTEIRAMRQAFSTPRLLLTVDEAGEALGLSRSAIYGLIRAEAFRVIHSGRAVRIPVCELEGWIARQLRDGDETWDNMLAVARGEQVGTARSTSGGRTINGARHSR